MAPIRRGWGLISLFERNLSGKPVPPFRDHAFDHSVGSPLAPIRVWSATVLSTRGGRGVLRRRWMRTARIDRSRSQLFPGTTRISGGCRNRHPLAAEW